jgi:hypothetical protein
MNPRAWVNAHLPVSTSLGCNGLGLLPLSGTCLSSACPSIRARSDCATAGRGQSAACVSHASGLGYPGRAHPENACSGAPRTALDPSQPGDNTAHPCLRAGTGGDGSRGLPLPHGGRAIASGGTKRPRTLPLSAGVTFFACPCQFRLVRLGSDPSRLPSAAPVALTHHSQRNGSEAPKGTASPLGTCSALTPFAVVAERRSCGTASNSVMWRDFEPRRIAPATALTQPGPRAPVFSHD